MRAATSKISASAITKGVQNKVCRAFSVRNIFMQDTISYTVNSFYQLDKVCSTVPHYGGIARILDLMDELNTEISELTLDERVLTVNVHRC